MPQAAYTQRDRRRNCWRDRTCDQLHVLNTRWEQLTGIPMWVPWDSMGIWMYKPRKGIGIGVIFGTGGGNENVIVSEISRLPAFVQKSLFAIFGLILASVCCWANNYERQEATIVFAKLRSIISLFTPDALRHRTTTQRIQCEWTLRLLAAYCGVAAKRRNVARHRNATIECERTLSQKYDHFIVFVNNSIRSWTGQNRNWYWIGMKFEKFGVNGNVNVN